MLDRMVEADSPLVIRAFEKKIDDLQQRKLVLEEKRETCGQKLHPFDEMYRTAMQFLAKPLKL